MSKRILIVEDETLVAMDLEDLLQDLGYQPVGIAADARDAWELAQAQPDLALVDLNLKDGLTGPEIGRRLAHEAGVPVVFMTANPRLLGDGVEGTVGVLTKPYDAEAVASTLAYALRSDDAEMPPPPALRLFARDSQAGFMRSGAPG